MFNDAKVEEMTPIGNKILVEPLKKKEVADGIYIPERSEEIPIMGIVIALGTGETDEDGKMIPFEMKVGDTVITPASWWAEVRNQNKVYRVYEANTILAILE